MLWYTFILKVVLTSIWLIIIRGTMPRYRIDHLLNDIWKNWVFLLILFLYLNLYLVILYWF